MYKMQRKNNDKKKNGGCGCQKADNNIFTGGNNYVNPINTF